MILAGDLRKGSKILFKNEPYVVADFQLVKPGKGGTYMRTKLKNLISGLMHEETFRSDEKLATPNLEYRNVMYVYKEGDSYQFLDQESYEQIELTAKQLGDVVNFLKEQTIYTILYFDDRPIEVNPPLFMELKVVSAPPGVRGDTAQGAVTKPAILETGLTLNVPLFVDEGSIIKVDTRDAKYVERIDKKR
ncbi:elongation factor P [Candidatus Dependentiae bacterium]|nr:elongation factor P [Candidatus Dependentiae bacterium]